MGRKYQVISGDGHLETPPDFVAYLPEKYKDRAPRLITLPDGGGDAWLMEGMPLTYASQNLRGRGKVKFQEEYDQFDATARFVADLARPALAKLWRQLLKKTHRPNSEKISCPRPRPPAARREVWRTQRTWPPPTATADSRI